MGGFSPDSTPCAAAPAPPVGRGGGGECLISRGSRAFREPLLACPRRPRASLPHLRAGPRRLPAALRESPSRRGRGRGRSAARGTRSPAADPPPPPCCGRRAPFLPLRASCLRHRVSETRGRPERRARPGASRDGCRSEEHTSELQSRQYLVCRLLLEKK